MSPEDAVQDEVSPQQVKRVIAVGVIVIILFAAFWMFKSSKVISKSDILESGTAYKAKLLAGEYVLETECTSKGNLFAKSGSLEVEVASNGEKINSYKKGVTLDKTKKDTTSTRIAPFATFSLTKEAEYQIKTSYTGDKEILSNCKLVLSNG